MSHVAGLSDEDRIHQGRSPIDESTSSRMSNVLMGIVVSKAEGITQSRLRIRIGKHTDLRVRWQAFHSTQRTADIGQTICVTIPEEAVHLEAGGFRRGKQRLNRYIWFPYFVRAHR